MSSGGCSRTVHRTTSDIVEHFKYGSIGSEENGLPYWVWQALPRLFPEEFQHRADYQAFGFLYELRPDGRQRDLPIGIGRREVDGIELAWFNCAVCHTGTVRQQADGTRYLVPAMPSNNLDLYRFFRFLLDAGADERLSPDRLIPAMREAGAEIGWLEEKLWRFYIIPRVREGLVMRRSRLMPLLAGQPAWGPGRVDTFNPYKLLFKGDHLQDLAPAERIGTADFPAVFEQGPRRGMQLHWDGNNPSLEERNLSAALGAGVTPETVDHDFDRTGLATGCSTSGHPPASTALTPMRSCAARPSTCASAPPATGTRKATATSSRASIWARWSRTRGSASTRPGSTPTRPSSSATR